MRKAGNKMYQNEKGKERRFINHETEKNMENNTHKYVTNDAYDRRFFGMPDEGQNLCCGV